MPTMSDDSLTAYENMIRESQLQNTDIRNKMMEQEIANYREDHEKSMVHEQLNLGEELERIDNLLKGNVLENGKWVAPPSDDLKVLSEYGVHKIREVISWYINKNTLLSNYDDETILQKMEDFSNDLNDTIFMQYEKIFQYPTLENCKEKLNERIERKLEVKKYAIELLRGKGSVSKEKEREIENQILKEIETRIEVELEKIKEQIIKEKLKDFMIIMRKVQDVVHSTYLRAWKGQERLTLRQHINISENRGGAIIVPQKSGGILPWSRNK